MNEAVTPVEEGVQVAPPTEERTSWLVAVDSLEKLTDLDVKYILDLCDRAYTGEEAKDIFKKAALGELQLWRIDGAVEGIVITRLLRHLSGLELYVEGMAGKRVVPNMKELFQDLLDFGKAQGVKWVGARAETKRLANVYKRQCGFGPKGEFLLLEV